MSMESMDNYSRKVHRIAECSDLKVHETAQSQIEEEQKQLRSYFSFHLQPSN